jgi:hypothetical protein
MRLLPFTLLALSAPALAAPAIRLIPHPAEQRVDVLVDGKPFTAYRFAPQQKKPVLFPLRTAKGTVITRGFPLEPKGADESKDHPHHMGLWLNFGDVNGVDFWGNTEGSKATRKLGSVVHRAISRLEEGPGRGALAVTADWLGPDGKAMLREETVYVFTAGDKWRGVDRLTKLTAGKDAITCPDNKEGMLGLRVTRALEATSKNNPTGTGVYRSSEGKLGDEVWGTRGRWMMLTGTAESEPLTIAILDHPNNPGFPTHWHARGYGLFAVNPLGGKAMNKEESPFNFTIPPDQSARFSYRILLLPGAATPAEIEKHYKEFVDQIH